MPRTMLSDHFCLAEFTQSQAAIRNGLDNTPNPEIVTNLQRLAETLETVRLHFCRPVSISSGYRSPEVNKAIGGSPTSAHRFGLAADFTVQAIPNVEVCRWIADNATDLGIDQIIYEFGPRGWVHVGLAEKPRYQPLTAILVAGKTVYRPGIVG